MRLPERDEDLQLQLPPIVRRSVDQSRQQEPLGGPMVARVSDCLLEPGKTLERLVRNGVRPEFGLARLTGVPVCRPMPLLVSPRVLEGL